MANITKDYIKLVANNIDVVVELGEWIDCKRRLIKIIEIVGVEGGEIKTQQVISFGN